MTDRKPQDPATRPGRNELRNFAFLLAGMIAAVFGLLLPWIWSFEYPTWPWIAAIALAACGAVAPVLLALPYRWWMRFAEVLGWINNRIILSAVFFLLILPFGVLRRTFGGDPMRRKLDSEAQSYRVERNADHRADLRRPY